jgi:hypothetical protein
LTEWVSAEQVKTNGIANVGCLVLGQLKFDPHRSDCQKTLATDRIYDAIFVMPVGECGFRLIGHRSPRSVTILARAWSLPIAPKVFRQIFSTTSKFLWIFKERSAALATA